MPVARRQPGTFARAGAGERESAGGTSRSPFPPDAASPSPAPEGSRRSSSLWASPQPAPNPRPMRSCRRWTSWCACSQATAARSSGPRSRSATSPSLELGRPDLYWPSRAGAGPRPARSQGDARRALERRGSLPNNGPGERVIAARGRAEFGAALLKRLLRCRWPTRFLRQCPCR